MASTERIPPDDYPIDDEYPYFGERVHVAPFAEGNARWLCAAIDWAEAEISDKRSRNRCVKMLVWFQYHICRNQSVGGIPAAQVSLKQLAREIGVKSQQTARARLQDLCVEGGPLFVGYSSRSKGWASVYGFQMPYTGESPWPEPPDN